MKVWKTILLCSLVALAGCAVTMDSAMRAYHNGDYRSAYSQLLELADKGSTQAQFQLGHMYAYGQGVAQNYATALEWLQKATDKGSADAQTELGDLYTEGLGVEQSDSMALSWYLKAAKQGDPRAQTKIGNMYETGRGVPQDFKLAMSWYRKASDNGDDLAAINIGRMYLSGLGVEKNPDTVATWFELPASRGNLVSELILADVYMHGYNDTPQDQATANAMLAVATRYQFQTKAQMVEGMHTVIDAHKVYPPNAIKQHASGTVVIGFHLAKNKPFDIQVIKSNGNTALDEAAVNAVQYSIFPSPPPGVVGSSRFMIPIVFQLNNKPDSKAESINKLDHGK